MECANSRFVMRTAFGSPSGSPSPTPEGTVSSPVSAVLFARHLAKVAEFYVEVFSARVTHSDAEHVALRFGDFALMIHQIPKQFIDPTELESPPARRERTAIRLDFP